MNGLMVLQMTTPLYSHCLNRMEVPMKIAPQLDLLMTELVTQVVMMHSTLSACSLRLALASKNGQIPTTVLSASQLS